MPIFKKTNPFRSFSRISQQNWNKILGNKTINWLFGVTTYNVRQRKIVNWMKCFLSRSLLVRGLKLQAQTTRFQKIEAKGLVEISLSV